MVFSGSPTNLSELTCSHLLIAAIRSGVANSYSYLR